MAEDLLGHAAGNVKSRPKLEGGVQFEMQTEFQPAGDQPTAITELAGGINSGERDQVLLEATGTGKTFLPWQKSSKKPKDLRLS